MQIAGLVLEFSAPIVPILYQNYQSGRNKFVKPKT